MHDEVTLMGLDVALLTLRLVIGLVFAAHGAQKLFGWFGGRGMAAHAGIMDRLGMRPPRLWAWLNALGEFLGGFGLVAGLLTMVAAAALIGSMVVAIAKVHWRRGFWNSGGGVEFPLVLAAGAFALGLAGPGRLSIDARLGLRMPAPGTFGAVLLLMVLLVGAALSSSAQASSPPGRLRGAGAH